MSEILIEGIELSQSFDYPLYQSISLQVKARESLSIVGRSGSGKSTLLHTLATFMKPDSGTAKLFDEDIYQLNDKELVALRRDEMGIIFQGHYLFKGMTGRENVSLASILSGEEIDEEILQKLEISNVIDQKIGDLSGGQQQRVSIARVLSKKPTVVFADEPTGNLDTQTASLVMDVLLDYIDEQNGALFLVTHDTKLAARCKDQYLLENQKLMSI